MPDTTHLTEIETLLNAAPPGPWSSYRGGGPSGPLPSITNENGTIIAMQVPAGATLDFLVASRKTVEYLVEEVKDYDALFALQHTRMVEGVALWRAEAPEARVLTIPDLGAHLQWFMAHLAAVDAALVKSYVNTEWLCCGVCDPGLSRPGVVMAGTYMHTRECPVPGALAREEYRARVRAEEHPDA